MVLHSRPDGSTAAARLTVLLPVRQGGWVPPPEDGSAPPAEPPGEAVPDAVPEVAAPGPSGRSWDGRGAHVALRRPLDTARVRLDPGRRGAVALVLVAALAAAAAGVVALRHHPQEVALPEVEVAGVPLPGTSAAPASGAEVVVAVAGKVRSPGLFRLPPGSRVDDAVRAAGGPLPGTDVGVLNLARRLTDGEQVLVGVAGAPAAASAAGGLLDLNAASASDLDALPGIGPVLAQRIVDWRTENGRFASVDQLREVTGIGEAKYEDLRSEVTV